MEKNLHDTLDTSMRTGAPLPTTRRAAGRRRRFARTTAAHAGRRGSPVARTESSPNPKPDSRSCSATRRSGSGNPNGRIRTALTMLKVAVLMPMPKPSVRTTTAETRMAAERADGVTQVVQEGSHAVWTRTSARSLSGRQNSVPVRLMLRALLADRFHMLARSTTLERPVYALTLARNDGSLGPRLRRTSDIDCLRFGRLAGERFRVITAEPGLIVARSRTISGSSWSPHEPSSRSF